VLRRILNGPIMANQAPHWKDILVNETNEVLMRRTPDDPSVGHSSSRVMNLIMCE
jgi:hypothetical protein